MRDLNETTPNVPEEDQPEALSEVASADKKKKNIDEMIEEFKRDNPAKNQKRTYRGVF